MGVHVEGRVACVVLIVVLSVAVYTKHFGSNIVSTVIAGSLWQWETSVSFAVGLDGGGVYQRGGGRGEFYGVWQMIA